MSIIIESISVSKQDDYTAIVDFTTSGNGPGTIELTIDGVIAHTYTDWYPGVGNGGRFTTSPDNPQLYHEYCVTCTETYSSQCQSFSLIESGTVHVDRVVVSKIDDLTARVDFYTYGNGPNTIKLTIDGQLAQTMATYWPGINNTGYFITNPDNPALPHNYCVICDATNTSACKSFNLGGGLSGVTIQSIICSEVDPSTVRVTFTTSGEGPDNIELTIDGQVAHTYTDWYPGIANGDYFTTSPSDPLVSHNYCVYSLNTGSHKCQNFVLSGGAPGNGILIQNILVSKINDTTALVEFYTTGEGPATVNLWIDEQLVHEYIDWYPGTQNKGSFTTSPDNPGQTHTYCVDCTQTQSEKCQNFNLLTGTSGIIIENVLVTRIDNNSALVAFITSGSGPATIQLMVDNILVSSKTNWYPNTNNDTFIFQPQNPASQHNYCVTAVETATQKCSLYSIPQVCIPPILSISITT